jgi:hypothetical protein
VVKGSEDVNGAREVLAEALRAPGRPDELAGLGSALAAFQVAAGAEVPDAEVVGSSAEITRPRPRPTYRRWRKPVLTAAATASLLLAVTTTAAEKGALPDPMQQMAHQVLGGLGVPKHGHGHRNDHLAKPGAVAESAGADQSSNPPGTSSGRTPSPSSPTDSMLSDLDLCKTILIDQKGLHSKAVDPAARDRLTAAAGGEDHIVGYCEATLTAAGIGYPPPPTLTSTESQPSPAAPRDRSTTK